MKPKRIPTGMLFEMIDGVELNIQKRIDSYKVKKEKATDNYDKTNQGAKIKASLECLQDVQTFRKRVKRSISERAAGVALKPCEQDGARSTTKQITDME